MVGYQVLGSVAFARGELANQELIARALDYQLIRQSRVHAAPLAWELLANIASGRSTQLPLSGSPRYRNLLWTLGRVSSLHYGKAARSPLRQVAG